MLLPSIDLLLPVDISKLKNVSVLLDVFDHVINISALLVIAVIDRVTDLKIPKLRISAIVGTLEENETWI